METYNGKLISADFEESTMEFEIQHEFTVKAGDYVILHKADYEKLVSGVESENGKLPIPHVSDRFRNSLLIKNIVETYNLSETDKSNIIKELANEIKKGM